MKELHKGHVFEGPNGQGYKLAHDLRHGETLTTASFEAFGGAPEPLPNTTVPAWLSKQLKDYVP